MIFYVIKHDRYINPVVYEADFMKFSANVS